MPPSVKGRRSVGGDEGEEGKSSVVNFSKLDRGKWLYGCGEMSSVMRRRLRDWTWVWK